MPVYMGPHHDKGVVTALDNSTMALISCVLVMQNLFRLFEWLINTFARVHYLVL